MPDPVDITDGIPQESQEPPQPTVEAPAAEPEPTVETIPLRLKDQERQLRADALQALAEDLGYDNAAAVVNTLRNGFEAQEIHRDARDMLKRAYGRQQAQPDAYYQEQEARRSQQYRQPQAPQYQQPGAADDDPLAIIKAMNAKIVEMDQRTAAMAEYVEYQRAEAIRNFQERQRSLEREVRSEYGKLADELRKKNTPDWKIPDMESLLTEAEQMGMFGGSLPPGDIVRRTYKMIYGDDIAQEAAAAALQAARSPKARVTVSTGKQVQPAAPPPANSIAGMEAALGNLRFGEVELPHERR